MTRQPPARPLLLHLGVLGTLFALQFALPPFHHGMVARIMVLAAYATGYNILLGYTGLMSLGHAMLFATGMYATGLAVSTLGAGAASALLAGLAASAVHAVALGAVALRTRGVTFLMTTMMFAQVFYLSLLHFNRVTGGDQGFVLTGHLTSLRVGPIHLSWADPAVKYNVALAGLAACLLLSLGLVRSPAGRVLVAIRDNEDRTRMLGFNPFPYKLFALTLSGTLSGVAGSIYALLFSYVGATFASILYSIYPLLWTLLGGAGTVLGPLVGTLVMTYMVDAASGLTPSYLIVVGVALVVIIIWFPTGILGSARQRWWPWLP